MFRSGRRYLVGVSGGVDSMVLVHVLSQMQIPIAIAHANFQLRGEDADADEKLVQESAHALDVPFHVSRYETQKYASEHRVSIQMAARELRQNWFDALIEEHQYAGLILAHHHDDRIETFFINLLRGTGLKGLVSMPAKTERVVRPLMCLTKKEIRAYAKVEGIEFREDASNEQNKYKRNAIRNEILPQLKDLNPSFNESMGDTLSYLEEALLIVQEASKEFRNNAVSIRAHEVLVDLEQLRNTPHKKPFLFEILYPFGFNSSQVANIVDRLEGQPGSEFISNEYRLVIDRQHLIISEIDQIDRQVYWIEAETSGMAEPFSATIEIVSADGYQLDKNPNVGQFDYEKLTFPLQVRLWRAGDRIQPLGMQTKKKVSDLLIDEKVPRNQKEKIYILSSEEKLLWVMGIRTDDFAKITHKTRKILKITLLP